MPRPRQGLTFALAAAVAAALGPAAVQTALAAAAGSLFEAAPFVLAAALLPRRLAAIVPLAGCGCAGRLPGALSLPATALCWIAFGPVLALGRLALAVGAAILDRRGGVGIREPTRRRASVPGRADEPLATLLRLAPAAAIASLVAGSLPSAGAAIERGIAGSAASVAIGIAFGALAPCATIGVAVAAAVARHAPSLAAGILMSAGIVSVRDTPGALRRAAAAWRRVLEPSAMSRAPFVDARPVVSGTVATGRASTVGLALASAALVSGGPAGLVNPRLLPIVAIGFALALLAAVRPVRARPAALAAPTLMFCGLVCGSPVPAYTATATDLDAAFAGERLTFSGVAHAGGGTTILERFEISCCRTDASPVAIALDRPVRVPDGTWIEASGTLVRKGDGLVLAAGRSRSIPPPRDPFMYR